jgi:hypothetical protein
MPRLRLNYKFTVLHTRPADHQPSDSDDVAVIDDKLLVESEESANSHSGAEEIEKIEKIEVRRSS